MKHTKYLFVLAATGLAAFTFLSNQVVCNEEFKGKLNIKVGSEGVELLIERSPLQKESTEQPETSKSSEEKPVKELPEQNKEKTAKM